MLTALNTTPTVLVLVILAAGRAADVPPGERAAPLEHRSAKAPDPIDNPAIDMPGFLRSAAEAAQHRASRRVTEEEFLRLSREPGTIVLDARSREKYDELHVAGAINLSFPISPSTV
jgi:hypothetical protein